MVTFQTESWRGCRDGDDHVLKRHYEEIAHNKQDIKLDPDWARYDAMEQAGNLIAYTARDEGKLVGYSVFFVNYHIHYNSTLVGQNDVLYLLPEYRKGMTGIRLIKYSIAQLEARGVDKIHWHVKFDHDFRVILERLGFVSEEVIVSKVIRRNLWQ